MTRPNNNQQQKKENLQNWGFAVSAEHRVKLKENEKKDKDQVYHPLRPVLDHSSDYTYYGNSLPQPCPPPSNLSATAWEKTDQKFLPGKVTMHSPAPRCDSLKVRPMALSERKRGYWQLKTGLQRGTYIAEQKK